jgi:hypothetical protein
MAEIARGELTAQELLSHEMGLHTEKLGGRSQQIFFDFDLNEAHQGFSLPNSYDVDYNKRAEIDASNMPSNTVNARIRELMQDGYGTIVLRNPGARHSIAVGILNRLNLIIEGSLGYFGCGLVDGPNVRISGRVGWSCAENMMSGTILIEKNAGSQFGAAIREWRSRVQGAMSARARHRHEGRHHYRRRQYRRFHRLHDAGGRMVICGNAGEISATSCMTARSISAASPASLGVDAVWAEVTDLDRKWLERKLRQYDLVPKSCVGHFRKIVAGKQLWNYDNLEPTEKKMVL